jgi:hypothetical protein
MSAYVTAKWGLRGLTRTLQQETRFDRDIHVCTVAPGGVDTPIYTSAANYAGFVGRPPPPVDSPDRVAAEVVRLADRPRNAVSVGLANRVIQLGFTLLPPVYDLLVTPMMRSFALSRQRIPPHDGNVFGSGPRTGGGPLRWGRAQVGTAAVAALAGAGGLVRLMRSRL